MAIRKLCSQLFLGSHMGFCCQVFRSSATRRYSNSRDSPRRSPIEIRGLDRLLADKKADLSDIQVVWDNGKILPERNGQIFGCPAAGGKNYLGTPGVQSVVNSVQVQK
jgi:hypothetical protein